MNTQIPFKPGEWVRCIDIDGFPANAELTKGMAYQVTSGSRSDMIYVENDLKVIYGYFPLRGSCSHLMKFLIFLMRHEKTL